MKVGNRVEVVSKGRGQGEVGVVYTIDGNTVAVDFGINLDFTHDCSAHPGEPLPANTGYWYDKCNLRLSCKHIGKLEKCSECKSRFRCFTTKNFSANFKRYRNER